MIYQKSLNNTVLYTHMNTPMNRRKLLMIIMMAKEGVSVRKASLITGTSPNKVIEIYRIVKQNEDMIPEQILKYIYETKIYKHKGDVINDEVEQHNTE